MTPDFDWTDQRKDDAIGALISAHWVIIDFIQTGHCDFNRLENYFDSITLFLGEEYKGTLIAEALKQIDEGEGGIPSAPVLQEGAR